MSVASNTVRRATSSRLAIIAVVLSGCALSITAATVAQQEPRGEPRPVRNDIARPGQEVLMLRHQRLMPGSHNAFYEASRAGVWPWYEKIGTRIVGQWKVVHPDGSAGTDELEEGWRLARYASYEHWVATRQGVNLGGNGADWEKNREAGRVRAQFRLGSDGGHFLQGVMHDSAPLYMPGLEETYLPGEGTVGDPAQGEVVAVRNDVAQPGDEIVTLRYWKIRKGTFDQFLQASVQSVWPWYEKVGARVIGQWKVIYPPRSADTESPDYDEVFMLTRYASYEHWQASRPRVSVNLGGNGPDWEKMMEAVRFRQSLSLETSVQFLQGYMYQSPPIYLPGLGERYRILER